ncbi:hypothetical protein EZS27_007438 [termite gut metagenome]|uniref:Uncharacterized protein n=1 Tax=termite gut metagenome TaxID=433724 RepID=A0A5J4SFN8_9ZZZZ
MCTINADKNKVLHEDSCFYLPLIYLTHNGAIIFRSKYLYNNFITKINIL